MAAMMKLSVTFVILLMLFQLRTSEGSNSGSKQGGTKRGTYIRRQIQSCIGAPCREHTDCCNDYHYCRYTECQPVEELIEEPTLLYGK
uniref:Ubs_38 putative toxin n=1 Tax=Unedogemmula bisaya TaxID=746885 RepID=A0A098LXX5_UNEBI